MPKASFNAGVEKRFVLKATQERIWELLGRIVLYCLPWVESVQFGGERTFYAVVNRKVFFFPLAFSLKGDLTEVNPPHRLVCFITLKSKVGFINLAQTVALSLTPVGDGKTEVICRATPEGRQTLLRRLLRKEESKLARSTLDCVQARLEQLCLDVSIT